MVTSPYQLKNFELDDKPETNKQTEILYLTLTVLAALRQGEVVLMLGKHIINDI